MSKNEDGSNWPLTGVPEQSDEEYDVLTAPPALQAKVWLLIGLSFAHGMQRPCGMCPTAACGEAQALSLYCKMTGPGPNELGAGGPEEDTHEFLDEDEDPGPSTLQESITSAMEKVVGVPEHVEDEYRKRTFCKHETRRDPEGPFGEQTASNSCWKGEPPQIVPAYRLCTR